MKHKQRLKAFLVLVMVLAQLPWSSRPARALTYTVTNTNDSGAGSLRQAIIDANFPIALPPHLIQFNIDASTDPGCNAATGVCTIQPASALPALTGNSITIDGYTQTGAAQATDLGPAVLKIVIDGSSAGIEVSGLRITSANNTIRGLVINEFDEYGLHIYGTGATDNTVSGNHIGTNVSGTAGLGNGDYGVYISDGAQNNIIGGDTVGERNLISGNDLDGIMIRNATNNTVSGNYIGTNASGTTALGNDYSGVNIRDGAQNNTIGGDMPGERNLISGNDSHGVWILGSGTMSNTISGNYIGTDVSGTAVLSNTDEGIMLNSGAYNTIGGDTEGERNIISGNGGHGVYISGSDATGNIISGNYIGLAINGIDPLGNGWSGVYLYSNSRNTTIGGDTADEGNVISNNGQVGIVIYTSHGNIVSGNYIGTDESGTLDRGNTYMGVWIRSGAQSNTIGGHTVGERNIISGNGENGVEIRGYNTISNTLVGNYIGTAANGTVPLGNTGHGVLIEYHAQNNTVEQNVISGNDRIGVRITGSDTMSNTISGNAIGTNESGTANLGNAEFGVEIYNQAHDNTIGPGNVVAFNEDDGVSVSGSSTTGNIITQNSIFSNTMGIDLVSGANGGIDAPRIMTTTVGSVNIVGEDACAGCIVEVFENSDTDGEGETYVGSAIADGSGNFTVTVSALGHPYLTATATDEIDGTSEFSDVFEVTVPLAPPVGPVFLPIIMENQ
jgi:titin